MLLLASPIANSLKSTVPVQSTSKMTKSFFRSGACVASLRDAHKRQLVFEYGPRVVHAVF